MPRHGKAIGLPLRKAYTTKLPVRQKVTRSKAGFCLQRYLTLLLPGGFFRKTPFRLFFLAVVAVTVCIQLLGVPKTHIHHTKSEFLRRFRGPAFLEPDPPVQHSCAALIQGDIKHSTDTRQMLYKDTLFSIPDSYYSVITANCTYYTHHMGYHTAPLSDSEREFPIAYIITVHTNAEQVERLLHAIYMPQNTYCIHIDTSASPNFHDAIQYLAKCFANVFISSKLEKVVYGGYTRLKADVNCMRDLLNVDKKWKYAINLAGQEFPLKSNLEIVKRLQNLNNLNDIAGVIPEENHLTDRFKYKHELQADESGNMKVTRTDIQKVEPPDGVTIYFGSAYNIFTYKFVEYVVHEPFPQQLLKWMSDTYSPDENYWATLQNMPETPGGRTDQGWGSISRAIKWKHMAGDKYPECQGKYIRDICVYGVGDLHWLTQQPHIFANKFDIDFDHIVLECLDQYVHRNASGYNYLLSPRERVEELLDYVMYDTGVTYHAPEVKDKQGDKVEGIPSDQVKGNEVDKVKSNEGNEVKGNEGDKVTARRVDALDIRKAIIFDESVTYAYKFEDIKNRILQN